LPLVDKDLEEKLADIKERSKIQYVPKKVGSVAQMESKISIHQVNALSSGNVLPSFVTFLEEVLNDQ
jgi:hypothetical protein